MTIELKIEERNIFGKKLKLARKKGKLPAVLYGKGKPTTPLFVDLKEFKKIWEEAGESKIIELKKENKKLAEVLINDIAMDPVKNEPVHVDFFVVEMDKPIEATVPLVFEGVAPAIKEIGGILVKVMHEVEVESLPKNLPSALRVDVSKLSSPEDQISVRDIKLPPGVKILSKEDEVIALIEMPKEEIKEQPISIEDVEVEKKGKKEVEGEVEEKE